MAKKTALVAGATGLVGSFLVDYLLADPAYEKVKVLTRRAPDRAHPRLETLQLDFNHLEEASGALVADHVFCCLGTTMAKAGSQEAFRKVDYDYPLALARLSLAQGAQTFALVSAVGADPGSFVFYNKVKGELEEAIRALGFPQLLIFRPSLLLGDRKETRIGEDLGKMIFKVLDPVMIGPLRRYRGVPAQAVALTMWKFAAEAHTGVTVVESEQILEEFEAAATGQG